MGFFLSFFWFRNIYPKSHIFRNYEQCWTSIGEEQTYGWKEFTENGIMVQWVRETENDPLVASILLDR